MAYCDLLQPAQWLDKNAHCVPGPWAEEMSVAWRLRDVPPAESWDRIPKIIYCLNTETVNNMVIPKIIPATELIFCPSATVRFKLLPQYSF